MLEVPKLFPVAYSSFNNKLYIFGPQSENRPEFVLHLAHEGASLELSATLAGLILKKLWGFNGTLMRHVDTLLLLVSRRFD